MYFGTLLDWVLILRIIQYFSQSGKSMFINRNYKMLHRKQSLPMDKAISYK